MILKKQRKSLALFLMAVLALSGTTACSSKKENAANPQNNCSGQNLPEGMTQCDCVDGHWENCRPGPAGECNGQSMPEWAVACDCAEEGWLNCRVNSDCTAEGIAACDAQGLQCRTDGDCYDARCEGVECDPGKTCKAGDCVFDACLNKTCPAPKVCNEQGNCISETGANILYELEGGNDIVDDNGETKAAVNIRLDSAPTADVRVLASLTGAGRNDVTVAGGEMSLTFTPENWETPQPLVIVGKGDSVVDGDKNFTLALNSMSEDADFNNLSQSVPLVNRDTETASVVLSLPDLLETSEDGGAVEIGVKLGGRPSAAVTIPLSVSNDAYASVTPPTGITIQPADWNKEKTITVTGKEDSGAVNTTPHTYQLIFGEPVTEDALFADMEMPTIDLVNIDNDAPQILVNKNPFNVSEGGGTDRVGVSLATEPTVETTITAQVTPSDRCKITEGATLSFTADDYSEPKNITIEGLDDDGTADGDHDCTLVLSGSSADHNPQTTYNGITPKTVSGTVKDNDTVGISQRITSGDAYLSENGYDESYPASRKICYALMSRPSQKVTLNITSSNTTTGAVVSPAKLEFDPGNYSAEKCAMVTAVDDGSVDGTQQVDIRAVASGGSDYNSRSINKQFTIYDRNKYGFEKDKLGITSIREGQSASFKFKLGSRPTANVTITLTSRNTTELIVTSAASLSISPENWDKWQTGTFKGVTDNSYDGSKLTSIQIKATSQDTNWNRTSALYYVIEDADSPGISLNCENPNRIEFATCDGTDVIGGNVYYSSDAVAARQGHLTCTVSLTKQPPGNVTVTLVPTQRNGGHYGFSNAAGTTSYSNWQSADVSFTSSDYTGKTVTFYYTGIPAGVTYGSQEYKAYDWFTITASTNSTTYPAESVTSEKFYKYNTCRYYYFKSWNEARSIRLHPGTYWLRAWGASGGGASQTSMAVNSIGSGWNCRNHGGAGAYMYGTLTLDTEQTLYVRTGKAGGGTKAYNGGSVGNSGGGGGGGGTDFCLSPGSSHCSSDSSHWPYRILVAGGGGGGPDSTYCYPSDLSCGADAKADILAGNSTASDGGKNRGSATYNGGSYYAQSGATDGLYTGRGDLVGDFFGSGMSISQCSPNSGAASRAGGGGGWYGGLAHCGNTAEVGGGAGSSYAFTGTRHGQGKQSYSYPLKNVGGKSGGGIIDYEELTKESRGSATSQWGDRFGNIGDGYAIIEVQPQK